MKFHTINTMDEGLARATLLSERVKPQAKLGLDATLVRNFVLNDKVVELTLPPNMTIEIGEHPEIGKYQFVTLRGVAINFHNGTTPRAGKQIVRARVMCVTWEPQGAVAQANGDGRNAFRNFSMHIDVLEESEAPAQAVLAILSGRERVEQKIAANIIDVEEGEFSHLSLDRKRAQTIVLYAPRPAD